jgi:hypothetical protein
MQITLFYFEMNVTIVTRCFFQYLHTLQFNAKLEELFYNLLIC